jgi:hypothetical protein
MKRFVNVVVGHTMLPQLAKRGRVLTAGDLEDGKRTDQDLFQNFLVQYNDSGKPSYSHHAFEYVDDFAALLISLHSQPQNGKMQRGSLGS